MVVDSHQEAGRDAVPRPMLLRPVGTWQLGTLLNPVAMVRSAWSAAGVLMEAVLALPRIAVALERLLPGAATVRELARLRGTLDRLEQLGGFLAEELPEVGHQLESVRRQLGASDNRMDVRLDLTEQQLRETATAVRALTDLLRARVDGAAPAAPHADHAPASRSEKDDGAARAGTANDDAAEGAAPSSAGRQQASGRSAEPAQRRHGKSGRAS